MNDVSRTATLWDALRQTEHFTVQDDGNRYHWMHYRPHGCATVSTETFDTYAEAAQTAVRVAACHNLLVDPIVEMIADQADMDQAQSGYCDWRWA
jgi:hypothetical protein